MAQRTAQREREKIVHRLLREKIAHRLLEGEDWS